MEPYEMIPSSSTWFPEDLTESPEYSSEFLNTAPDAATDSISRLVEHSSGGVTESVFPSQVNSTTIPSAFKEMSIVSRNCVVAYCVLFLMAAFGNSYVFFMVIKQFTHYKSRISLLMVHLSLADLMVTFFAMPMEIIWRITIQWYGGDFLCKFCQFFRAFALYLSSMIVICISLDRYFAIIYPLKLAGTVKKVKRTLTTAWISALVCASPQLMVFRVMPHPEFPSFRQCVTETFLRSDVEQELVYNVFSVSVLYFLPLSVIIFTYSRILFKIYRKSKEQDDQSLEVVSVSMGNKSIIVDSYDNKTGRGVAASPSNKAGDVSPGLETKTTELLTKPKKSLVSEMIDRKTSTASNGVISGDKLKLKLFLRKSTGGGLLMARARIRTLRLTCVIVLTFIFCWTPYVLMTLWYMVDREGAKKVDERIQEALFIMAVANSVVNPLIYGTYGSNCRSLKSFYNGHCCVPSTGGACVKSECRKKNPKKRLSNAHTTNNYCKKRRSTIGGVTTSLILTNVSDHVPCAM